jgi:hypothetical protein
MSFIDSQNKILNESTTSANEIFFNKNKDFIETNVDSAFKDLNTQFFNIVNTTFSNFNSNYENKLDENREAHEKAILKLNSEIKELKIIAENKQELLENSKAKLILQIRKLMDKKLKFSCFRKLKENLKDNKFASLEENVIVNGYFHKKYLKKIISAWNHIAFIRKRNEVVVKYQSYFNSQYEEKSKALSIDIQKYSEILKDLENKIAIEIDERRKLTQLYDNSMSKAANLFVNETNTFQNFSSSNVQTPKERLNNRKCQSTITY